MDALDLTAYLDDYLAIGEFPDYEGAYNGLQVAGKSDVRRVAVAVDACQATIERAIEGGADFMIVHHGLFWGMLAPITGPYHARLSALIKNDVGLYSCHLPLDAHPEVGNNHILTRSLGLSPAGVFGEYKKVSVGVWAVARLSRESLVQRIRDVLRVNPLVIPAGPSEVRRIGVVTGGGGSMIGLAASQGLDTFLTGEGQHHTYFEAEERGINVIYAGHYATETVGVKALGDHLSQRFGLDVSFLDHPTGL